MVNKAISEINITNQEWINKRKELDVLEEKIREHYMGKVDELLKDGKTFSEIKEAMREIPDDCVIKVLVFRKILILEDEKSKSPLTETQENNLPKIKLYYERYMKSFDIVNDVTLGPGTLFGGDSGYINEYDELIEKLKDDMKNHVNVDNIEFVKKDYMTTFIKGYAVWWD